MEEVAFDDVASEFGESAVEIFDTLAVDFHDCQVVAGLKQRSCQHTHARSDFEHRHTYIVVERGRNFSRHTQVGQKVLTQSLFRFNLCHREILTI